ncbi:MAG: hypothetical protein HOA99_01125 [Candidatus Thioglobus sp.]|nr:hypothetical protein [Candidatus Thioglobus sp.]
MINATLAQMRNSEKFFKTDEVIHIINGRKKQQLGFFVPEKLREEFKPFLQKIEDDKNMNALKLAAEAQRMDPIGDSTIGDGI